MLDLDLNLDLYWKLDLHYLHGRKTKTNNTLHDFKWFQLDSVRAHKKIIHDLSQEITFNSIINHFHSRNFCRTPRQGYRLAIILEQLCEIDSILVLLFQNSLLTTVLTFISHRKDSQHDYLDTNLQLLCSINFSHQNQCSVCDVLCVDGQFFCLNIQFRIAH